MALNYSQRLNSEVQAQKSDYIQNFFVEAENVLISLGLPNNVYFRDLFFDIGANQIREISTGNAVSSYPLNKQFMYFPQGVQLLVRALDYNYYPV